jgi:hypothetical protein
MLSAVYNTEKVFDAGIQSAVALTRSHDVNNANQFIQQFSQNVANGSQRDLDLSRRQFEINEYHYHNKLDTLFFLQIFFIAVISMAIIVYLNRTGFLTTQMTGILTGILAILLVVIGVTRYFYTTRTRDRRLWHRRYFQTEKAPGPELVRCAGASGADSALTVNLHALFSENQMKCSQDVKKRVNAWNTTMQSEIAKQIATNTGVSSLFSSVSAPDTCAGV